MCMYEIVFMCLGVGVYVNVHMFVQGFFRPVLPLWNRVLTQSKSSCWDTK